MSNATCPHLSNGTCTICAQLEKYGAELDEAAKILQKYHPIGKVKAIGRLEVALALGQVLEKRKPK